VGKIAEKAVKAVCRSVFLTIWHCILSAEFFGDFAHWALTLFFLPARSLFRKWKSALKTTT